LRDPILKKPFTKKGWWSGSRCRPLLQTPALQKKGIILSQEMWLMFVILAIWEANIRKTEV
jgi:hypothetical protein